MRSAGSLEGVDQRLRIVPYRGIRDLSGYDWIGPEIRLWGTASCLIALLRRRTVNGRLDGESYFSVLLVKRSTGSADGSGSLHPSLAMWRLRRLAGDKPLAMLRLRRRAGDKPRRKRGILFVAIDLNKPLSEHGPFDIVLHKLTGKEWRQILEKYKTKLMKQVTRDQNLGLHYNFSESNVSKENATENSAFLSTELLRQRRDFFAVPATDNLLFQQDSVQKPSSIPLERAKASMENMNLQRKGFSSNNSRDPNSFGNNTLVPALGNHFPINQTSHSPMEFQLPSSAKNIFRTHATKSNEFATVSAVPTTICSLHMFFNRRY